LASVETVRAIALGAHGLGAELDDFEGLVDVDAECDGDLEAECEGELAEWLGEVTLEECAEVEACGLEECGEVELPAFDEPPPPAIAPMTHQRMSSTSSTTSSATSRRTQ
jgi:hypothetical protein